MVQVAAEVDTRQLFFNVCRRILQGSGTIEEKLVDPLLNQALAQIKFSVYQLAEDLLTMGFSQSYALTTSAQITPKPVLYSTLVRVRNLGIELALARLPGDNTNAHRMDMYVQVAPEITAFLFDQTIDGYNLDYRENTAVQILVDRAKDELPTNPNFYRDMLSDLLKWTFQPANAEKSLPTEWKPFLMLRRYIDRMASYGVSYEELHDVLYTVADVITNEHLSELAFAKGQYSPDAFLRYYDFADSVINPEYGVEYYDDPQHTVARAMLRGQGFLMVVASQYMMRRITLDTVGPYEQPTLRSILGATPELFRLIRLLEAVVRLYDDIGDESTDIERCAPNILSGNARVKQELIHLSGIADDLYHPLGKRVIEGIKSEPEQLMLALFNMEQMAYELLIELSETLAPIIQIIRDVVYGSMINAVYNDQIAESIGQSLIA